MAGQSTHMEIAYNLAERMGIDEGRAEFILGSIAPDSVPFTEPLRAEKIHSHLFENCGPWGDTQDYDQWLVNISDFYAKYVPDEKDIRKKMFLLGICVHCWTDYWNDLLIWRVTQRMMIPPMNYDEFKAAYYPEAQRLGLWLFQTSPRSKEISALLASSEEYDFEDYVKAEDLKDLKDYLLNEQYNVPETVDVSAHKYFTSEMLLEFIDEATTRIHEEFMQLTGLHVMMDTATL